MRNFFQRKKSICLRATKVAGEPFYLWLFTSLSFSSSNSSTSLRSQQLQVEPTRKLKQKTRSITQRHLQVSLATRYPLGNNNLLTDFFSACCRTWKIWEIIVPRDNLLLLKWDEGIYSTKTPELTVMTFLITRLLAGGCKTLCNVLWQVLPDCHQFPKTDSASNCLKEGFCSSVFIFLTISLMESKANTQSLGGSKKYGSTFMPPIGSKPGESKNRSSPLHDGRATAT